MALMNAKQYAEHRGVSAVAVHKWITEGKLGPIGETVQKTGRLYLIDSERADILIGLNQKTTMQQAVLPLSGDDGTPSGTRKKTGYNDARTLDAQYAALLKKLEFEVQSGIYVLASEVESAAFNLARTTRDAILNVPDRIAPILAAEVDPQKVAQLLTVELTQALEELMA